MMRRMAGSNSATFGPGRSKARRITTKKRFKDIAGNAEVKEEV